MKRLLPLTLVLQIALFGPTFGDVSNGQREIALREESKLYAMFLDNWAGNRAKILHVARIAKPPTAEDLAEYATCLKTFRPGEMQNPTMALELSKTPLARRRNVKLVDPATWRIPSGGTTVPSGQPSAEAVSAAFAAGLLTFTRAIFDEQHKVAIFTYSFVCGGLCGGGNGIIFDMTPSGWQQREMPCGGWIS